MKMNGAGGGVTGPDGGTMRTAAAEEVTPLFTPLNGTLQFRESHQESLQESHSIFKYNC